MPSPFGMLLGTMPFAGAVESLSWTKNKRFEELSAAEMRERVTLLPEGASIYVELPARDPGMDAEVQPLWAFSYTTARPAEVGSVYCRVRDADHVGHQVADRIAWGLEAGYEPFKTEIRVKFKAGADLRLPLTKDFLLWAFRVRGGHIRSDHSKLWRLESVLDTSIVAVFAFDIDPATGQITKTDFDEVHDPTLREDLQEMSRAVKELLGGGWPWETPEGQGGAEGAGPGGNLPPPPPDVEPEAPAAAPSATDEQGSGGSVEPPAVAVPEEDEPWGQRVLRGDLFPEQENAPPVGAPPAPMGVSGVVGDSVDVATEPARLLVVFSFTTCCERADFEPGGVVGFARCYPHLLVAANAPVETIEGSAHIDRPKTLSRWHEEGRDMSASCCKPPYDGWTQEIGSLLVTDVNQKPNIGQPLPFWSNMFYYYLVDPFASNGQKKYHVVRTDRPTSRISDGPLVGRRVFGPRNEDPTLLTMLGVMEEYDGTVRKRPRQGAFDNVHMAPRLRLMNVTHVVDDWSFSMTRYPVEDRRHWQFDDIAMAPFCAHDCLHMHFRWSEFADAKHSLGWNATGPYAEAGAPQVPVEQDVWVWFRARAALTYHVLAKSPRFADGWHVLMHHGFGYAVSIQGAIKQFLAMTAVDSYADVTFVGSNGDLVEAQTSTAAYYWKARFGYEIEDGEARPFERLTIPSKDALQEAMDL